MKFVVNNTCKNCGDQLKRRIRRTKAERVFLPFTKKLKCTTCHSEYLKV